MRLPLLLQKAFIHTGLARWLPGVQRRLDGGADYLRHYSNRLLASPLADLEAVADHLSPQDTDAIDLGAAFPSFDLLPSTSTKLPADRRGWPPALGLSELRTAVSDKLRHENDLSFNPAAEILITSGVVGAVQTVLDAFVNRGDTVVLFDPCSPLYSLATRSRRARLRWLPTWIEDGRTRFRVDHLARTLRGARLMMFNAPVNPTGGTIAAEDLEQIAWWADRHDVLLLSDESFERYAPEDGAPSLGTLPGARQRTLTAGGVSQGYALASMRVGWLAAYRHLLRPCSLIAALRNPFVPTLNQQLARAALRLHPHEGESFRNEFASRRRFAFERLRAMELNPVCPAGGYFLWVPVWERGFSGRRFAEGLLRDRKVRITPGDLFGPSGIGYVRISCAGEEGRLQEGLNRLADYLQCDPTYHAPRMQPLAA